MRHAFAWHLPVIHPGWTIRAAVMLAVCAGLASVADAQSKPKAKPGGTPGGHGGGGGAHAGGGAPTSKATVGGAKKGVVTPTKTAPPAPPEPVNPTTGIPLGFEPKKEPPELMLLEQPTVTEDSLLKWKKDLNNYRANLRKGLVDPAAKAIILNGIRYRLGVMTFKEVPASLKEPPKSLADMREDLTLRDLQTAGTLLPKPEQTLQFRQWVMEEVVKEAVPLLENSFYVRVHIATLLGELNLREVDATKKTTLLTYTPAVEPLRKVIRDPNQPDAVKIAAARSMVRLIRYGELPVNKQLETSKDVLTELANPGKTHYWYQMRLVEVLSTFGTGLDTETRKPTIVNELKKIIRDPDRNWHVRAEAARSLGRVTLDPQVSIPELMVDITQFAHEMAKAAQKDQKAPQWKMTFFKLYLAFQPLNPEDRDGAKKGKAGLLNNPSAAGAANQCYTLIVPIVNAVINGQTITDPQVKALDDWLQKNRPPGAFSQSKPNENVSAKPAGGNGDMQ